MIQQKQKNLNQTNSQQNNCNGMSDNGMSSVMSAMSASDGIQSLDKPFETINGIIQPPFIPHPSKAHRNTTHLQFLLNTLMNDLLKHPCAWYFYDPVDTIKFPDYPKIIKQPMDLGTIKKRLENCYYYTAQECIKDFKIMFKNCYVYNSPRDDIAFMAKTLEDNFLKKTFELNSMEDNEIPIPTPNYREKEEHSKLLMEVK